MDGERSETELEAMEATYTALAKHGYAGLTIQTIADSFPKSKSLLYYHYNDKEAIIHDFLGYLTDAFRAAFEFETTDAPRDTLEGLLDALLPRDIDADERAFRIAVLELLAQAPHDETSADYFADLHTAIYDGFVAVLEAGIESGAFEPVDAERAATLLVAVASGGLTWSITVDPAIATRVRDVLDAFLAAELYR